MLGCVAVLTLLVVVVGLNVGFGSTGSGGPHLRLPPGPVATTEGWLANVKPGQDGTFGSMVVCLDKPGSVTITGVKPVDPQGGIRIDEFGVRPWTHLGILFKLGNLEANHFHPGRTVDVVCNKKTGAGYELAVAISRPSGAPAGMGGVVINYTSDGDKGSLTIPNTGMVLCPHGNCTAQLGG